MSQSKGDVRILRLDEPGHEGTFQVHARARWSTDAVEVRAGEVYQVSAAGTWRHAAVDCGPDGRTSRSRLLRFREGARRVPHAPWLALSGALDEDDGSAFLVGREVRLTAPRAGRLRFFANNVRALPTRCSGALSVTVTRMAPPKAGEKTPDRRDRARVYPRWLKDLEGQLVSARRRVAGVGVGDPTRVGFALSGGGIRSATFCLGLFQVLARRRLVRRIDFLSTVSGGGYFGGFLGALFTRDERQTGSRQTEGPAVEAVEGRLADSSSKPVHWLRQNGRYLSPAGVGDLLLALAAHLRNLVSLHVIIAVAAITTVLALVVARRLLDFVGLATAVSGNVPVWTDGGAGFVWSPWVGAALVPLLFVAVPAGWAYWLTQRDRRARRAWAPAVLTAVIATAGLVLEFTGRSRVNGVFGWDTTWPLRGLWVIAALALALWSLEERLAGSADQPGSNHDGDAGSKSGGLDDIEFRLLRVRNRLTRVTKAGIAAAAVLVVLGVVDSLGQSLYAAIADRGLRDVLARPWTWPPLAAVLAAIAVARRFAGALPMGERLRVGWQTAAWLAASIVVTVLATIWVATAYAFVWGGRPPDGPLPYGWAAVGLGAGVVLCWALGRAMQFVNNSSFHALYAARLTRAYLGASNPERSKPGGARISEVVKGDAIGWLDYQPHARGGPAHIVNVTINETIGGRDQIEYRDRKGLGMALGPTGVSIGATHHAEWGRGSAAGTGGGLHVKRPRPEDAGDRIDERFHPLFAKGELEHEVQSRQVGHWMAISGAAFTTGLGSRTSLPLAILLGLANVRLGYWWDSHTTPGTHAREARPGFKRRVMRFVERRLLPVQTALVDELLGRFWGPAKTYWYLSDGGHFENTGCYELLRRGLEVIVCCDCGADPEYLWTDLANLVRKARIDFGAEIRFLDHGELDRHVDPGLRRDVCEAEAIGPPRRRFDRRRDRSGSEVKRWAKGHAIVGLVRYLDGGDGRGDDDAKSSKPLDAVLLIVKPSLTGDEPADVLEYARSHESFPHESTLDQYFDEAQWESYRRLGQHVGEKLFPDDLEWLSQLRQAAAGEPHGAGGRTPTDPGHAPGA